MPNPPSTRLIGASVLAGEERNMVRASFSAVYDPGNGNPGLNLQGLSPLRAQKEWKEKGGHFLVWNNFEFVSAQFGGHIAYLLSLGLGELHFQPVPYAA